MAYTNKQIEDIFSKIIEEVSNGRALRNVLKDEGMPSSSTFYIWLEENEDKSKQYARACEVRADQIFDEILDIADDGTNDTYVNEKGQEVTDQEVIGRSRLRVDSRKWIASKLNPKKYGDSSKLTLDGKLDTTVKQDFSDWSNEDLKVLAELQDKNKKKDE
jgi:hypothetical protein